MINAQRDLTTGLLWGILWKQSTPCEIINNPLMDFCEVKFSFDLLKTSPTGCLTQAANTFQ